MISKFWTYLGILLACSKIDIGLGVFLIICYIGYDLGCIFANNNIQNTNSKKYPTPKDHYDDETLNELK